MLAVLRRRPGRQRLVATLLLLWYLPACSSWHVEQSTPAEFVQSRKPAEVRVTRNDGSTFELTSPFVRNDSLVGMRKTQGDTLALSLGEVSRVESKVTSPGSVVLVVTAGLGVIFFIGYAATGCGDNEWC